MIKLVVCGHGNFATGIISSLELIAGSQENVVAVDFTQGMSSEDIKNALENNIKNDDQVFILCDLLGGTPFKMATEIMLSHDDKDINVVSGLNLSMLLEATFSRSSGNMKQCLELLKSSGKEGINDSKCLFNKESSVEFEGDFI